MSKSLCFGALHLKQNGSLECLYPSQISSILAEYDLVTLTTRQFKRNAVCPTESLTKNNKSTSLLISIQKLLENKFSRICSKKFTYP